MGLILLFRSGTGCPGSYRPGKIGITRGLTRSLHVSPET